MLKKIRVLFLGLVVLAGSACVTPTHASSASSVVLTYIQAAGPIGAKDELIIIQNNTGTEIDITDWCLVNKASVLFTCFEPLEATGGSYRYFLPAYSSATIASRDYLSTHGLEADAVSLAYTVTNLSSGSIVNSADSISLLDENHEVRDVRTWTAAPASGKAWSRILLLNSPNIYAANNSSADWSSSSWVALPQASLEVRLVATLPEVEEPEEEPGDGEGELPESPNAPSNPIVITEILANPTGVDAGREFIELFNPDVKDSASLSGLKLRIGLETAKWYDLPNVDIPPLGYVSFSDTDLGFSLANTKGGIQLYRGDVPLGERIEYSAPKDNMAWALIEGVWQYSNIATPGIANRVSLNTETNKEEVGNDAKPCASNQFRNPETGRCKLLSSTITSTAQCKTGQERNPTTNRCRNIVVASTSTPCKVGQERNPETNRCRNITKMSDAEHGVKGIENKSGTQPSWYYWAGIAGVLLLVVGYAIWEWREELSVLVRRIKVSFAKR